MQIVNVGVGFMILIAGRPAYFVFVGGMAYVFGAYLGANLGFIPADWSELFIPMVAAILGVLLTFIFRRWAAMVAGFIAGFYALYALPVALGTNSNWVSIPLAAVAGGICAALLFFVFDIALIAISSLTAPILILQSMRTALDPVTLYLILVICSAIIQYLLVQYGRSSPD